MSRGLNLHFRKLIHVLTASVIALVLGVLDRITQAESKSLTIRAGALDPSVVFVEVINFLHTFHLGLEIILGLHVKAAVIRVKGSTNVFELATEGTLNQLVDGVENHGDVEANETGLEADLITSFLQNDLLSLVFLISVIEFRHLSQDPEDLAIELLLQVCVEHIINIVLVGNQSERKNIAKGAAVILNSLIRLFNEGLYLLIDDLFSLRLQSEQQTEKSDEVE